jgi:ribosomal-protein-alanine N-acetyltransferase
MTSVVNKTIEITPLLLEEVDLIMSIENSCHAYPSSLKNLSTSFSKRYHNFKMTLGGKIVGFYMAELVVDEMTLHNICIDPSLQGKGYGRKLFEHFLDSARAHKVVQLWLEVRESNASAIALYQNSGFDVAGTRRDYYPSDKGREDALLMGSMLFYD